MVNTASNRFLLEVAEATMVGEYRAILMDASFSFNVDNHRCYNDVVSHELDTGNNYTVGGLDLENIVITEYSENDWVECVWDDLFFEAIGGDIGPTSGVLFLRKSDDEYDEYDDEFIIGFMALDSPYTIENGGALLVPDPTVRFRKKTV